MKAKSTPASASSPPESQVRPNGERTAISAEEGFAQAEHVGWGANLPKSDDEIDYSDIPPQEWSGPNVVRGKYRELALAAQGIIVLDADVRRAFPDADAVNRTLRRLIEVEPAPIDLPAVTVARARDLLTDLQTATIDRAKFDPQMKLTDETLQSGANHIRPYGEPLAFTPVELRTTAEGDTAVFRVRFAAETLTWAVRVDPQGMINGFDLRHNARGHIYRIVTRLIEGY